MILEQPAHGVRVWLDVIAAGRPRHRLDDRPAECAPAVEAELVGETVEPVESIPLAVPELEGANDWGDRKLPLAGDGLRIDHEPGLAHGGEPVLAVQVLGPEPLRALARS